MSKLKIWLFIAGIIVFVVVVAPFIHYLAFGKFPQGFPIQVQNRSVQTQEEGTPLPENAVKITPAGLPKMDAKTLKRINGFTPFYYERNNPPDLEKLNEWGANAVTIIVEDEQGFMLQNKILKENGVNVDILIPALPPPGLDVEKEVETLVLKAHSLGLVVNLAIPVTEKWLKKAEDWKVGMIWVNGESDAMVQDRITPDDMNKVNTVLLKVARKHYSGLIGTGFTNLIDRTDPMAQSENPHVRYINVSGFDFITINPHPDPSMKPNKLLDYVEATAKSARKIADKHGIEKVILGAVMVKAKNEKIQGFTNIEGYAYTDEEEKDFYAKMFERTGNILDGYFLDFSGWEKRPAVEVIRIYYKKSK
jgi:hypothetical protein